MRRFGLLFLAGCKGCVEAEAVEEIVLPYEAAVSAVVIAEAMGEGPLTVPLFATDLLGAPVPAAGLGAWVNGTEVSVTADGAGWGSLVVEAGPVTVEVSAGVGEPATAVAWVSPPRPADWGDPAIHVGVAPSLVSLAGEGVVWADGGTLWWADWRGTGPIPVLDLTASILGMDAVQLDGDGVTDLLVWSGPAVALLRGRPAGGLTLASAWVAPEGSIVQATLARLNTDAELDLAVAVVNGGASKVGWILGASTGWTYDSTLSVPFEVWGLSTEDLDANGEAEVTVLTSDALLRRYSRLDGDWVSSSEGEYTLALGPGARLHPAVDMDGDDIPEFVATGPDGSGVGQQAYLVSTPERTVYRLFVDGLEPEALAAEVRDLDGDGLEELVLATEARLYRADWNASVANFDLRYVDLACPSPVTTGDVDGDLVPDVVMAGAEVRYWPGARVEGEWGLVAPSMAVVADNLVGSPWVGDTTGDGIVDVVGLTGGGDTLTMIELAYGGTTASTVSAALSADALDLAVCTPWAYVLVETDSAPQVKRFHLPELTESWAATVEGSGIDCVGDAAVVTGPTGATTWLRGEEPTTSVEVGEPTFAFDVVDGDGSGERLARCTVLECDVLLVDLDADGVEEEVRSAPGEVSVAGFTRAWEGADTPALSADDVDGDGRNDLLVVSDDVVRIYGFDAAYGLSPPRVRSLGQPVSGVGHSGDVDGDALPDLLILARDTNEGDGVDWTGQLLYAPAISR